MLKVFTLCQQSSYEWLTCSCHSILSCNLRIILTWKKINTSPISTAWTLTGLLFLNITVVAFKCCVSQYDSDQIQSGSPQTKFQTGRVGIACLLGVCWHSSLCFSNGLHQHCRKREESHYCQSRHVLFPSHIHFNKCPCPIQPKEPQQQQESWCRHRLHAYK